MKKSQRSSHPQRLRSEAEIFNHPIFSSKIFLTLLNEARKEQVELYLVGGFLRDCLLGRQRRALDLDVTLVSGAIAFGRKLSKRLACGFVVLDKKRGCCRLVIQKGGQISLTIDFADFRDKDLHADLLKRDFTMNTLALRLSAGPRELLDLCGARDALRSGIVRIVTPSSFDDDPLRILRAFSLAAQFGFRISKSTLSLAKKKKNSLQDVAGERLRDELFRILAVPDSWRMISELDRHSILQLVIPQVVVMHHVKQGGYHHLDVWGHSLETLKKLEELLGDFSCDNEVFGYLQEPMGGERTRHQLIKLAALLHDIGKPQAHEVKAGKTMFHGHERIGRFICDTVSERLKLSTRERLALDTIIFWHLRPGYLADTKILTKRAIHRYFRDTRQEAVSVLLVAVADQRATRGPMATKASRVRHEKVSFSLIKKYFEILKEEPFCRLIGGRDLIKRLKLTPGPIFSVILNAVEEAQVEGRIKTKEEALAFARSAIDRIRRKR